jgi:hypothetical protein
MVTSLAHQPRRGRRDTRSGNNFAVWGGRLVCPSPNLTTASTVAPSSRAERKLSLEH